MIVNDSAVSRDYVCEGETRYGDGSPQKDTGRLGFEVRWWIPFWSDESRGAKFQSKNHLTYLAIRLKKTGEGNFSEYTEFFDAKDWSDTFTFRRAVGELRFSRVRSNGKLMHSFMGECKEAR